MFNFFKRKQMGTGAIPRPYDARDRIYDEVVMGSAPLTNQDWINGFNVEDKLKVKLPIKNQNGNSSCVGQGWSYYIGVLDLVETKKYSEVSAKAIYSQIHLSSGGAYIMDGGKLAVNWGAVNESLVSSYDNGKPSSENFMRDLSWKDERADKMAKILQAKEYRKIEARDNMDLFAMAIRDNWGIVGGVYVGNNGSWRTNEPTPSTRENGHCLYFGKFGVDKKGKYISTPNSWGERKKDALHSDGWQKLRQDYFNKLFSFDPWTLIDQPNQNIVDPKIQDILIKNEKKIIIEAEGHGKKGIIINGELREIVKERESSACLYTLANNDNGLTVSSEIFEKLPKGVNF